jgi:phospholipase D-like protein
MIRVLPALLELALLIYCLIDCIQTPTDQVRNLAKGWWIVLILLLPLIGGIAWLVAGRPVRARGAVPWPSTQTAGFPEYERPRQAPRGPDDDPEFLRQLRVGNAEQEELLRRWEDDLRQREQRLRRGDDEPPATP